MIKKPCVGHVATRNEVICRLFHAVGCFRKSRLCVPVRVLLCIHVAQHYRQVHMKQNANSLTVALLWHQPHKFRRTGRICMASCVALQWRALLYGVRCCSDVLVTKSKAATI